MYENVLVVYTSCIWLMFFLQVNFNMNLDLSLKINAQFPGSKLHSFIVLFWRVTNLCFVGIAAGML